MSERNTSIRQKNILKKTTKNIRRHFSTKNYQKLAAGTIAFAVVFLLQLSASGETRYPASSQQSSQKTNETSQATSSTEERDNAPHTNISSSPQASVKSSTTSNNAVSPRVSTQVTVNGENIPANDNGSLRETITTPGGTTTIDITTQNNGNSWNSSSYISSFHSSISNNTVITNSTGGNTN